MNDSRMNVRQKLSNDLDYLRWERIFSRIEKLNQKRDAHSIEATKLAQEADRLYNEMSEFWREIRERK